MTRLTAINPTQATGKAKTLLDAVQTKLGITPNLMRTMANSPAVLQGYLNFSGALAEGSLNAQLRELIALAVAESNHCEYCLSAHTAIGQMVGLNESSITNGRIAFSDDPKVDAALKFVRTIVVSQGEVTDADVDQVRRAGYSDGDVAEMIANVALNIFTNYFNHIAQTEVDFPKVELNSPKAA